MLGITLRKLLAKRWMFFCMLLGCVLMIAIIISLPLYENATFDKMLRDLFKMEYEYNGVWPATYYKMFYSNSDTAAADLFAGEELLANMGERLGVTTKDTVRLYQTVERRLRSTMGRNDDAAHEKIQISMLSDLERHMDLMAGSFFSEDGLTDEGYLEAVITIDAMLEYGYLVDEVLEFLSFKGNGTEPQRIKIVGVVEPKEDAPYWDIHTKSINSLCFISEEAFADLFLGDRVNNYFITCYQCYLFEFEDLMAENVSHMRSVIKDEAYEGSLYKDLLVEYEAKRVRISATLLILQVPALLLLTAFLFMISRQMFEVERNEIAVIKSRGSSRNQLFRLYFYQTGVLVLLGLLFGIPLGIGFLQLLGNASGFLEFEARRSLDIRFDEKVFIYLVVALALIIGTMSIPAIKHSKLSIVNLKQNHSRKKRVFWELCFLDVICLVIGWYGYDTFSRIEATIAQSVLKNEPLNPLLYISSTATIIGLGLLYLRLLPLFVKLVYKLGEKRWKPATYASFQEIIRNNRKQHFVMLFLIMSIAFGIYHATVAQTIMDTSMKNAEYISAVDVIVKEKWRDNSVNALFNEEWTGRDKYKNMKFYEADMARYETLDGVKSYTKVYYDDGTAATKRTMARVNALPVTMMLIHPKEFGEMTWVARDMLDEHYYTYLNMLVDNEQGFIVSKNFLEKTGYEVGNAIILTYSVYMLEEGEPDQITSSLTSVQVPGIIVGVVDCWPGYVAKEMSLNEYGNVTTKVNYLVVGSYFPFEDKTADKNKPQPYEVWIDMEDDADTYHAGTWINEQNMKILKYQNRQRIMSQTMNDPLLQGTNGILTLEFIVMILLCGVGYLVYWMMSIRDRELMFGIFRAFGMHKRELFGMLFLEQLFSGVLTTLVGIGIGKLSCKLFAPMMIATYTAAQQAVLMKLQVDSTDMMRLYGSIALVLVMCMVVLVGFVFRLDATKALKLGED